jgi:hypothetical protein
MAFELWRINKGTFKEGAQLLRIQQMPPTLCIAFPRQR